MPSRQDSVETLGSLMQVDVAFAFLIINRRIAGGPSSGAPRFASMFGSRSCQRSASRPPEADLRQLENALSMVAINVRDAMPEVGTPKNEAAKAYSMRHIAGRTPRRSPAVRDDRV